MADPTCVHTAYDFAKDFQQTFTALIALTAAVIAYRGVIARISYDKKSADTMRQKARLSLCTRLKFKVKPFRDQAASLAYWLTHEKDISLQALEEQMRIWPATPSEIDEALQNLDAIPVDAIEPLNALRELLSRMAVTRASSDEEKRTYFKIHVKALTSIAKETEVQAGALITVMDNEISVMGISSPT